VAPPHSLQSVRMRFPAWHEIISVFGLVVFAVHGWSVWQFLYYLPSFILKYEIGEIVAIFSYQMTFAFLESMLVCGLLVLLSGLLPTAWFRIGFVHKAFLLFIFVAAGSIVLQNSFVDGLLILDTSQTRLMYIGTGLGLLLLLGLLVLVHKVIRLQKLLEFLVDQVSVMLFLFLPLDAIGLVVVTIRLLR
jgi:hypothetical protein